MEIDLDNAAIVLCGETNPIVDATLDALRANGGRVVEGAKAALASLALISFPLVPPAGNHDPHALLGMARSAAIAMDKRGGGRIVMIFSALAGIPMRRHPEYSLKMAASLTGMRTLAMEFGPTVLVNAVGLGAIAAGNIVSSDAALLSHTSLGRAGTIAEAVAAVLFFCDPLNSYTTGQMLAVDGGWAAGYGRSF